MFKGALGQQSSDMPAIVGGIASLGAGGFELEEIGLATGLRVCRVMGVIGTSRLTTSFSWSAVLPGDLGTALSSKVRKRKPAARRLQISTLHLAAACYPVLLCAGAVMQLVAPVLLKAQRCIAFLIPHTSLLQVGIQGGTAELSMYSPAYQQVIGLALDNFVFTAASGGAVSISLDRQPDAVSSTAPPTLDWLLCAKPAAGNAKPVSRKGSLLQWPHCPGGMACACTPACTVVCCFASVASYPKSRCRPAQVTLADFAALLGPVGVATDGIPGLEAVLKSVSVKQLYIELDSANGAIKLEGISVKAEIAPLTLLPGGPPPAWLHRNLEALDTCPESCHAHALASASPGCVCVLIPAGLG